MKELCKNNWIKRIQVFVELSVFIIGFVLLLHVFTNIVSPKYLFNTEYSSPETEMWEGFDELQKNSLDFLFVGSSHFYNGVNPVVIYEKTGYTSYTMTCSGADMPTAYFLTNYALRTQKPQVVFLDVYAFFYDSFYNEAIFTKCVDGMKYSKAKMEAIKDWQEIDPTISTAYRVFPILDYHNRWEELTEYDFTYKEMKDSWMGFAPCFHYETVTHDSFMTGIDYELPVSDTMLLYFSKMVQLCNENGIQLILVEMPCEMWDAHLNDTVGILAEQYGVSFWDFNLPGVYDTLDLDLDKCFRDPNHLNMYGGTLFSYKLAEKLQTMGIMTSHTAKVTNYWNKQVAAWNEYYEQQVVDMFQVEEDE